MRARSGALPSATATVGDQARLLSALLAAVPIPTLAAALAATRDDSPAAGGSSAAGLGLEETIGRQRSGSFDGTSGNAAAAGAGAGAGAALGDCELVGFFADVAAATQMLCAHEVPSPSYKISPNYRNRSGI